MREARLRRWTLAEFLALKERQPAKYEFINGKVRLVTEGTRGHDRIVTNILIARGANLRGSPCRPAGSDLRVVTGNGNVRCLDVVVDCGLFRAERRELSEPFALSTSIDATLHMKAVCEALGFEPERETS
jgi:Uma2 family endonuclease